MIPPLVHHRDVPSPIRHLLPEGIHDCTISEIQAVFVFGVDDKDRDHRQKLFESFLEFGDALVACGVSCELWIDGSFASRKIKPEDLDLITFVHPEVVTLDTLELRNLFNQDYVQSHFHVHQWLIPCYPASDPKAAETKLLAKTIVDSFQRTRKFRSRLGVETEGLKKGILRTKMGERVKIPDVDLWLRAV